MKGEIFLREGLSEMSARVLFGAAFPLSLSLSLLKYVVVYTFFPHSRGPFWRGSVKLHRDNDVALWRRKEDANNGSYREREREREADKMAIEREGGGERESRRRKHS